MSGRYSSKTLRQDPKFLRNLFSLAGKWGILIIKKNKVDIAGIQLIGSDKIRKNDTSVDVTKTVHFFVEDNKLNRYYDHPEKYLDRLAPYHHVFTPDYSLYADMPLIIQMYNTFKNRWCGAYWQDYGLSVIPSVSWSTEESFEFCFDGIEQGSIVAISTVGNLNNTVKNSFLRGYFEMIKRINPEWIICFGKAFPEMGDRVVVVRYPKIQGG